MTYSKKPLGDVANFIRGITFKPEDLVDMDVLGAVVCMRTKNVQADLDESDLIAIPQIFVKRSEQYLIEDDLLVSTANSWELVGKTCWVPKLEYAATAGGFISILRANRTKVFPRYLYHWMVSAETQHNLRYCGRQTTNISNMSLNLAEELEIPLPPLDEQRHIAAILDKADAIRRKRQESIHLTEEFLRSTFLEMFGDPVTNPKGWERKEFGEIMYIDSPMVDPKVDEYLDLLHIGPDRIEKGTGRILPALTAREDGLISGKFLFDERHVLYSKIRPLLRKAALPNFKGLCSADMYPIRPNAEFTNREFLWSILLSDAFTDFTQTISSRANIPKINRTELASYKCIMPPLELQNKFAKVLGKNTLIGTKLTNSAGYIDDLFAGLTHRAFRGEL